MRIALIFVFVPSPEALAEKSQPWVARLTSVEGTVEVRRTGTGEWSVAAVDDTFVLGDSIRVLAYSRAAVVLPDETILRLDQNTTATFIEPRDEVRSWLELIKGVIHVISRDLRALKIITPYARAGLEGTEFSIGVGPDGTVITVIEGEVSVVTDWGDTKVSSGQRAIARSDRRTEVQVIVRPTDAVHWSLYYAPVLVAEPPPTDAEVDRDTSSEPAYYTDSAARKLAVGRVEEARADLAAALLLDSDDVNALALQSIIAVTTSDKEAALALAQRAVSRDPESAAALIALSYAQQARFDIPAALASLQTAVRSNPNNGLAWARLAELWLASGNLEEARDAAEMSVSLNSMIARPHTVLGFAYLAQVEIEQSINQFRKAISQDPAAPLPRLGLGLALIRSGKLVAGRAEIEVAVILDPANALIRSYAGKAYYEEKRVDLAGSQLGLAKRLDPLDPTPWYYDAIRKQTINRPIPALDDLHESIERNDNRAIYRSNLKLDEDMAARSASLGRIYRDLGFEQRALVEGWRSVNADPSDFSGHRFLADTYAVLPRHEIARVSELLQSQLLQPLNLSPIQPQLAETNLFLLSGSGPSDIAFNEFNPLFARDRVGLQFNGVGGGDDIRGYDFVVSGVNGPYSYSVGRFDYETDGVRENNDQERDIHNIFAQARLSVRTSVQAELRSSEADTGDLDLLFDPASFSPARRRHEENESVRLGMHHAFEPGSDLLLSLQRGTPDFVEFESFTVPGGITGDIEVVRESDAWLAEIQHIHRGTDFKVISGLGRFDAERDETEMTNLSLPFPPFSDTTISTRVGDASQANAYVYSIFDISENLALILGLSVDSYESKLFDRDQENPKLGVTWQLTPATLFRAAAFRTLHRALVTEQTIEPTQVAGFNQFFDGFEGDDVTRIGLALDHKISRGLFTGIELSQRDLVVPIVTIFPSPTPPSVTRVDQDEKLARAYLSWLPTRQLAFGAAYLFEDFDREGGAGDEQIIELRTHRLPLSLAYFSPDDWSAKLKATYIDQRGVFTGPPQSSGSDEFWVLDAAFSYRLPKRSGILSLQVKNLTDEDFRFQDTDPKSPSVYPDRLVLLKLTLSI